MTDSFEQFARAVPSGIGLGLRPDLWEATLERADAIDFVEITLDDYLRYPLDDVREWFEPVRERFDIVAHSVGLSLASADRLDKEYLDDIARLLDGLGIEVYTEHCSFIRCRGHQIGQFLPVPFTDRWADHVAERVEQVQAHLDRTIALENISYVMGHADVGLGEAAFFERVLERADCGLLFDVTNLAVNAANHHYDPLDFLERIPGERAAIGHIAGGHIDSDFYIDSHGHPVRDETLALLAEATEHIALSGIMLERDKNYPDMREVVDEIERVRAAMQGDPPESPGPRLPVLTEPDDTSPPSPRKLDPEVLQAALCLLFEQSGRYEDLYETETLPERLNVPDDQRGPLLDYLLSFTPEQVELFAKILRYKRREKLEGILPGTCRILGDRLYEVLDAYFREYPDQSRERAEEGEVFAEFVLAREDLSNVERDLVLHETTVLSLRKHPYRIWKIWSQRQTRTLSCHPRQLDRVIHADAALPAEPTGSFDVLYKRQPEGVWVEVVD